jgi:hypothetical protein
MDISFGQVSKFCGNVLEVHSRGGEKLLSMSSDAFAAFTQEQLDVINKYCKGVIYSDVPCIQAYGGGGTRCMIAEIFLPCVA